MFTHRGIAVDSWVTFEDECRVTCAVAGNDIQLSFGHNTGSLNLVTTPEGLAKLIAVATEVQARLAAIPPGDWIEFQVPDIAD